MAGTAGWAFGQPERRLRIGHTGITWDFQPDDAGAAIRDIGRLGYAGYETFGEYLDAWELKGGLKPVLDSAGLPLISAYCNVNLTDPAKRWDEVSKIVRWAKLIQKCGGVTAVIGPNGVRRSSYDFKAIKADVGDRNGGARTGTVPQAKQKLRSRRAPQEPRSRAETTGEKGNGPETVTT